MTNPYDPAFTDHPVGAQVWTGLTKREYFAAMVMQGIVSNGEWMLRLARIVDGHGALIAKQALEFADALIAELNK